MLRKKISSLVIAAIVSSSAITPMSVFADNINSNDSVQIHQINEDLISDEAQVSRFDPYYLDNKPAYQAYSNKFRMKTGNIESVTSSGGEKKSILGTSKIIDGVPDNYWETNRETTDDFKNTLLFTLKKSTVLDRIIYKSGPNKVGFAEDFEIWGSDTSEGDTFKLVATGKSPKTSDFIEIKFKPTKFKRIKFVFKNKGTATAAEMMFFKEDPTVDKVKSVFTDNTMATLSDEYNSMDKINELEKELNKHPLKDLYMEIINHAKDILSGKEIPESQVITLSQRGSEYKQRAERRQVFIGGNLDLTGYYVMPGESFEVYLEADRNGILPEVVFSQVGEVDSAPQNYNVKLKVGKNIVTAPSGTKPYAIYLTNKALPEQQKYAPKVRIAGDNLKQYPIYIYGKTDENDYIEQVKNHKGANMTDVMGDRFLISGKNSEAKIAYVDRHHTPLDTVKAFDKYIAVFDKLSGYDKNDPNPVNRPSNALFHFKGSTGNGLFATDGYIHYAANTAREAFSGNLTDWGFAHEFGHQVENSDMRILEVTNNLYSIAAEKAMTGKVQRDFTKIQENVDKYFTFEGTKGFGGFPGDNYEYSFGLFERLLVLTQITNYFGDEAYTNAFRLIRENPSRYNSTGSNQAIITAMSEATGYDLTPHFEYYNYPVTEATKEFTSQFKKLDKKIRYTTIDTYKKIEDNVQTFNENTKAVINNVKKEADGFKLELSTNDNNKGTIAYEIYRDGKLVGFNRTGEYKDKVDSSKEYKYDVIAYDYRANESQKSDTFNTKSIIYKPSLDVKDNITIKENTSFDPLEYVSATTFDGKDIEKSRIKVTGKVDTNKKGKYEITYDVEDRGYTTSKTVTVEVYEDFNVKKSRYGKFDNLNKYNEEFKIPVASVTSKGGNYGTSTPEKSVDGKMNTHWETNKPNSSSFKNEVTFDFGKTETISKIAYGARQDAHKGRGFATNFEIYVSNEESGDNFVLSGKGEYKGNAGDIVEFNMKPVKARRIKFKFVDANDGMTSLSEIAFYKEDELSNKVENDLFLDDSKTEVSKEYDSLDKLEELRKEIQNHPAYNILDEEIVKAEKIVKAKLPVITASDFEAVKINSNFDYMTGVTAMDQEDGNITNKVKVDLGNFNIKKAGEYNITYTVTDNAGNTTSKTRKVLVYSDSKYISDMKWDYAVSGWKSVNKDSAVNTKNKIKLKVDGNVKEFNKGIGASANAEVVYDLDGNYNVFTTYLGTDKNYNSNDTSIIFKIYADGKEVYTSDLIKTNSDAEFVNLDVTGVKKLKLVAEDAGNGGIGDFSSWADAKVYTTNSKPELNIPKSMATTVGNPIDINQAYTATDIEDGDLTKNVKVEGKVNFNRPGEYPITYTVVDSDGNEVVKTRIIAVVNMNDFDYLTDFDWKSQTNTYKAPNKDLAISSKPLRLTDENGNEVTYKRGIGAHSTSTITYDLSDKHYGYFTSYVGVDRNMYNSVGSVSFEVYVDGEKKFDSGLMNSNTPQKFVQVDITGAKELKLVVTDGGNGNGSDHATWGDTKLHYAKESQTDFSKLEELVDNSSNINELNYTKDEVKAYKALIEEAKSILNNSDATQDEVDLMVQKLNDAIGKLVVRENKVELEKKIKEAKLVENNNYDSVRWDNFLYAIEYATDIYNNIDSTDDEIRSAIFMLDYSKAELN